MNQVINFCNLKIEIVRDYYYIINGFAVIMQPSRLDQLKELHGKKHLFKDFEDFKRWIEN